MAGKKSTPAPVKATPKMVPTKSMPATMAMKTPPGRKTGKKDC